MRARSTKEAQGEEKNGTHISGYSGKDTSLECTSESYLFRRRTWFPLASSTCCTSCAGSLTEQTGHRRTRKAAGEWGEGNRKGEDVSKSIVFGTHSHRALGGRTGWTRASVVSDNSPHQHRYPDDDPRWTGTRGPSSACRNGSEHATR